MNVNKKIIGKIISNTMIFVAVLVFVGGFKTIFGDENTAVGITTIVFSLSLLSRDLTKKPIKNFILLIGFNVITILGAYVFEHYLWLGLIANFLIITSIGYIFMYEVRKPFNMLFGLQYILFIGSPIIPEQLPKRLFAGVISVCIVMALQVLVNRNKLVKTAKSTILSIEEKILLKITLIRDGKGTDNIDKTIEDLINNFKISIFESGQIDFKITNCGGISVDILACIEKIDILLNQLKEKQLKQETFDHIYFLFESVKNKQFDSNIMKDKCENQVDIINEFASVCELLQEKVKAFEELLNTNKDNSFNESYISEDFNLKNRYKMDIKKMSYRAAYAIRIGILFSITGFVTKLFDLEFGKWMMFTVFALTQPHAEYAFSKSKKRVSGTIIGAIILLISFMIIRDSSARMAILLVAGYLLSYFENYKYRAIIITVCATCVDAINNTNPYNVILYRVLFVLIGVGIALLANRFLFRREYKDEAINLINIEKGICNRMLEEVISTEKPDANCLRSLYLLPALIENRVITLDLHIKKEFIHRSKVLVNDIYQTYLSGKDSYDALIKDINEIMINNKDISKINNKIYKYKESIKDLKKQELIISISKIIQDNYYVNKEDEVYYI